MQKKEGVSKGHFSGLTPSPEEMIDLNHSVRAVNQVIDNLDIDPLINKYQ